ncbi:hypothetical protein EIP86_010432 [Pleurotus ostreatoroseus]|nr:hypothetical protein EIP86_010432 [Pleurotus ostreatoroseus]
MRDSYLVTGGGGLLGHHIVDQLLARGEISVAVFDIAPGKQDSRTRVFAGDISDRQALEDAVKACGATCIIHTVSVLPGPPRNVQMKVNIGGTENVLSVAKALSVPKLVYTSSASVVFDGKDQAGVDESLPYPERPFDDYNETKTIAEKAVLSANGHPRDRLAVPSIMGLIEAKRTGMQIGDNSNLFDWTYIENAAHAHLLAADRLSLDHPKYAQVAGEAFFITNGEPRPYWDFPRALWKVAGHTPTKITVLSRPVAMILAAIMEFIGWITGKPSTLTRFRVTYLCTTRYFNIEKARRALDYEPIVALDEGIKRSAEYWIEAQKAHADHA